MLVCLCGCGRIPDGEYAASVTLTGGSGKAYIESPCVVTIENGKAMADITWSSPNYDYMVVDGVTFTPVNTDGNSEFVIPIRLNKEMAVQADTTAMSTPHLIDYTLLFELDNADKETSAGADNDIENNPEKENESLVGKPGRQTLEPPIIDGFTRDLLSLRVFARGTVRAEEPHRHDAGRGRERRGRLQHRTDPVPDRACHRHEPADRHGPEHVRRTAAQGGQAGHGAAGTPAGHARLPDGESRRPGHPGTVRHRHQGL